MSELIQNFRRKNPREKAATLVVTLLVVVLLSTIVVAFMQTVSLERRAAASVANRYQAELAAEAGLADAESRILSAVRSNPRSATFFQTNLAGVQTLGLYLSKLTNVAGNLAVDRVPMFSTAYTNHSVFTNLGQQPIETASLTVSHVGASGSPTTTTLSSADDVYTDLNSTNTGLPNGEIGLTNAAGPLGLIGNWVYQTNSEGVVVGRYAFWVDDESSKVDLRTAGTTSRLDGTNLGEVSVASFTNSLGLSAAQATNLAVAKDMTALPPSISFNRFALPGGGAGISDDATWARLRTFITQHSLHDLRSPDGNLSINLNELVTTTTSAAQIEEQVETIITSITNNLPNFGDRYYQATGPANSASAGTPSVGDQTIYLRKIAANIRDFIDDDNTATVILNNGSAYNGTDPTFGGVVPYEGTIIDDIPAVGKEKGPYLNEYAVAYRVVSPENTTAGSSTDVTVTIRFAHYVELYNPTSEDISYSDLGPNPRIVIANQPPWINKKDNSNLRPADIRLDLPASFSIPAGGYAVLTTDGPPFTLTPNQPNFLDNGANRYELTYSSSAAPGTWSLLGTGGQDAPATTGYVDYTVDTKNRSSFRYEMQMNQGVVGDYANARERLLFVNDEGLIDYTLRVYSIGNYYLGRHDRNPTTISTFIADGETKPNNTNPEGSESPRFGRGDPRANTEISEIGPNTSCVWKSGRSPQYGDNIGILQMTLGDDNYEWATSTGTTSIARKSWAEYSNAGNGYIANANMTSVGDLGFLHDPARFSISGYRSVGRTLRVGQPDLPEFNRNNNSSVEEDSNQIGGLGTDDLASTNYLRNAFQLANIFRTDTNDYGKINPNGMLRGGADVIAGVLFDGFVFAPATDPKVSGSISGQFIHTNAFVNAVTNELGAGRPFLGVGDLSRLAVFATSTNTNSIVTNQSMSAFDVSDGDREEAFRRTAGLLSTQSLAFTVYAVGQSGKLVGSDFQATSTDRKHVIVRFVPEYVSTTYPATPASWSVDRYPLQ